MTHCQGGLSGSCKTIILDKSQRNSSLDHRERQEALTIQLVSTINKQDDPAKILYFKSKEKVLNQSTVFFKMKAQSI